MMQNNKAYVAGAGATISQPIAAAIGFGLQHFLPIEIATPLGAVIAGFLVGALTYYVPNIQTQ